MNFICPYIGNVIIPTDFHIFQRGRYTTNKKTILVCLVKHPIFPGQTRGERFWRSPSMAGEVMARLNPRKNSLLMEIMELCLGNSVLGKYFQTNETQTIISIIRFESNGFGVEPGASSSDTSGITFKTHPTPTHVVITTQISWDYISL